MPFQLLEPGGGEAFGAGVGCVEVDKEWGGGGPQGPDYVCLRCGIGKSACANGSPPTHALGKAPAEKKKRKVIVLNMANLVQRFRNAFVWVMQSENAIAAICVAPSLPLCVWILSQKPKVYRLIGSIEADPEDQAEIVKYRKALETPVKFFPPPVPSSQ